MRSWPDTAGCSTDRFGTYEEVARRADLDRRTAKRYVHMGQSEMGR